MPGIFLIAALLLQVAGAYWIFQKTETISSRWPWLLVSTGMLLFALLDGMLAWGAFSLTPTFLNWAVSLLSLIISAASCAAVYFLIPWYVALYQSERESREISYLYRSVFDAKSHLIALKDPKGVYQAANPAFCKFFEIEVGSLIGKTDQDFLPQVKADLFQKEESNLSDSGLPLFQEHEFQGAEGSRWLEIHRSPILDDNQECQGILFLARDITDRKAAESSLYRYLQGLGILADATLAVLERVDIPFLLAGLLNWSGKLGESENGFIGIVEDGEALVLRSATTSLKKVVGMQLKPGEDLGGKAWQTGQVMLVEEYDDWPGRFGPLQVKGFGAAAGIPLRTGSKVTAVLSIFRDRHQGKFSKEDLELLNRFARIAAIALENAQTYTEWQESYADDRQKIEMINQQVRQERLLSKIAAHFISLPPEKIDQSMDQALQALGRNTGFDRGYVSLFSKDSSRTEIVARWIGEDAPVSAPYLSGMDEDVSAWWIGKLNRSETIYSPRIADLPQEASESARFLQSNGIRSVLVVPLVSGRSVIGYMAYDACRQENKLSSDHVGLFRVAADVFTHALERKWAGQELLAVTQKLKTEMSSLQERNTESKLLTEMGDLLLACRTADEAYPIIARYARRLMPAISGSLYLVHDSGDMAERVSVWGVASKHPAERELVLNECWALRRGRMHVVTDISSEPICGHIIEPMPQSYLCAPLNAQGETLGLLHLRADPGVSDPSSMLEDRRHLALMIAEHVSLALSNLSLRDELRSQAIRDPLTGLFNRRYMEATLERELRRAVRHNTTVGVILFDIDRLKPVNDNHGHDAGDTLLRALGELLLKTFRGEDVACRYGGDEFTVVLPEASLADIWQRAEQLRNNYKTLDLQHEGRHLDLAGLSIGVAAYPDHGTSVERLLQVCDAAAYLAKAQGGDRVMIGKSIEE